MEQSGLATCVHCGAACRGLAVNKNGRDFCCHGCLTVFELLNENGLGQFYKLADNAGVTVRKAVAREQFSFLDDAAVRDRLLDFNDGHTARVTFHIPSIHCVACVWLLENLFKLRDGIGQSQVQFDKREVSVQFEIEKVPLSALAALLTSIGYEPTLTMGSLETARPAPSRNPLYLKLGVAGFAFGNIMLFSICLYSGMDRFSAPIFRPLFGWVSLVLALPVMIYSASDYWRAAWVGLRQRMLTIDLPIALGLVALFSQSAFEVLGGRGVGFLDSLTGLVFFLLVGRVFQQKTYERLSFDRDYRSFFPLAVKRRVEGREESVPVSELGVGDHLVLRHGELIPADSRVVRGQALIDYSFVTGESDPVERSEGEQVHAGGQQVGGALEVETVKPVSQSYLTSLWGHESFAKDRDRHLNSLLNRFSRVFTLGVIGIALAAAVWWSGADSGRALRAFTSVLIVACPCALALTAPFALGTAQRLLARRNVFLKSNQVVEDLASVDAIVFDKTGTLTSTGAGAVRFVGEPLRTDEERWVRAAAAQSSHPHSVRIASALSSDDANPFCLVENFEERQGKGIVAVCEGHIVRLGTVEWLATLVGQASSPEAEATIAPVVSPHPDPLPKEREQHAHAFRSSNESSAPVAAWWSEEGGCERGSSVHQTFSPANVLPLREGEGRGEGKGTFRNSQVPQDECGSADKTRALSAGAVVHIAVDGCYRGCFQLGAALRHEIDEMLRSLGGSHELALLSGDNDRERERFQTIFGKQAQLRFNQSPVHKLEFIKEFQKSGRTVMMVGDGLNDAGALRCSDVGVAVVENIGTFSPASDVILEGRRVPELSRLLRFARRTVNVVWAGIAISLAYNAVGLAFAASGRLSPVVCAILMPLSSISVVAFACGAVNWAARRAGLHKISQQERIPS